MQRGLVGSEMCIRDRYQRRVHGNNLLECAKDLIDIEHQVIKILNEIKEVDVTNIIKLVECIVRLFGCFQKIFKDIVPCIKSYDDINKLVHKIIDLTPMEILQKLMLNLMDNARNLQRHFVFNQGSSCQ
eukprot:TRINITY_DN2653_c0_g1_i2.p2 TRINITY_DN2653_c0_g1~~TRINITY_DN2653_c0_g1_i2.p2  ORF type:complete len:129 (-),score=25.94 TRINITY_DN2653_c0_g1_i2:166-552(-)